MLFHFTESGSTGAKSPFPPTFDGPFGDFTRYPGEIAGGGLAHEKWEAPRFRGAPPTEMFQLVLVRVAVMSVTVASLGLFLSRLLNNESLCGEQQCGDGSRILQS